MRAFCDTLDAERPAFRPIRDCQADYGTFVGTALLASGVIGLSSKRSFYRRDISCATSRGRMGHDPLQNIVQPRVGIEVLHAASRRQALEVPDNFRGRLGPAEHPVLASQLAQPHAALNVNRIDGYVRALETGLETASVVARVADGVEQEILSWTRHVRSHSIAPSPDSRDNRPGMLPPLEQLLPTAEHLLSDLLLLGVEIADEVGCLVAVSRSRSRIFANSR